MLVNMTQKQEKNVACMLKVYRVIQLVLAFLKSTQCRLYVNIVGLKRAACIGTTMPSTSNQELDGDLDDMVKLVVKGHLKQITRRIKTERIDFLTIDGLQQNGQCCLLNVSPYLACFLFAKLLTLDHGVENFALGADD